MNITVTFTRTNQKRKLEFKKELTIEHVLKKLNLKPDTVIVIIKNHPVPIDDKIKDGDELTILHVSSGG